MERKIGEVRYGKEGRESNIEKRRSE